MDDLQIQLEQELSANLEGNYELLDYLPALKELFLADIQNLPWQDQIKLALGVEEFQDCESNPHSCTKTKMPMLSTKMVALTYAANGKDPKEIIQVLVGVFMIQQASSILDDIQDADRDTSLDKVLGLSAALNIALLLLCRGQEIITNRLIQLAQESADPEVQTRYLKLVPELSGAIGTALRGQLLDIEENKTKLSTREVSQEKYTAKLILKSGARFSFLAELGATLGGADEQTAVQYWRYGCMAGLALNMMSDLYDFAGAGEDGIDQCRDYKMGVFNLPLINAYEYQSTDADKKEFLKLWEQSLTSPQFLEAFKQKLIWNKANEEAIGVISYYIDKAEQLLNQLDPGLENPEHRELVWLLKQHISVPIG